MPSRGRQLLGSMLVARAIVVVAVVHAVARLGPGSGDDGGGRGGERDKVEQQRQDEDGD
jgi:hypothetical protein